MNYLDFELEIGSGAGREYPVEVVRSPAGEAREVMRFPFDDLALENRLQALQIALLRSTGTRRLALSPEERAIEEFGRDLFNALLTGEVRARYDLSLERARLAGSGLRLKLRIHPAELAALPWEYLYDPREAEFVSLSTSTPLVRYLELPQPVQPLTVTPPLRILVMMASPRDLPPLDVTRERQRIERAIEPLCASGLLDLTFLEGQTWRDLQRAMRGGPWHIFHFVGHGGFDKNADEGLIVLADEEGDSFRLRATQLGLLLADHLPLRLALLNACEGARGSGLDIFSSTAAILVRRGLPAVLAMQYEITDRGAIEFARSFYEAVADGLPVDAAVAEARKAINLAVADSMEWGTPVLYMRSPDGVLFNIQGQAERLAQERAAAQRVAWEKAEQERLAEERAEQERLAREKAEAERLVAQKAEAERLAREQADQERLASERAEAERRAGKERARRALELAKRVGLPAALTALGWGLGLLLIGTLFESPRSSSGLATFGAVGGLTTGIALLLANLPRRMALRIAGGWAAACAAGWAITGGVGQAITSATDRAVIGAIGWQFGSLVGWLLGWAVCGTIIGFTLRQLGVVQKRPAFMIGGGWTLGGVLGWAFPQLAAPLLEVIGLAGSPVWDILAGAVGSAVMFWQLGPARQTEEVSITFPSYVARPVSAPRGVVSPGRWAWRAVLLSALGWALSEIISFPLGRLGLDIQLGAFGAIGGLVTGVALRFTVPQFERVLRYAGVWLAGALISFYVAGSLGEVIIGAGQSPFFLQLATCPIAARICLSIHAKSVLQFSGVYPSWYLGVSVAYLIGWAGFGAVTAVTLRKTRSLPLKLCLVIIGAWIIAGAASFGIPQLLDPRALDHFLLDLARAFEGPLRDTFLFDVRFYRLPSPYNYIPLFYFLPFFLGAEIGGAIGVGVTVWQVARGRDSQ